MQQHSLENRKASEKWNYFKVLTLFFSAVSLSKPDTFWCKEVSCTGTKHNQILHHLHSTVKNKGPQKFGHKSKQLIKTVFVLQPQCNDEVIAFWHTGGQIWPNISTLLMKAKTTVGQNIANDSRVLREKFSLFSIYTSTSPSFPEGHAKYIL